MARAKYKEYFELMIKNNSEAFDSFKKIHDAYALNPDALQEKLNQEGTKIQRIVFEWQDKLCNRSEGTGYASFTGSLAEKFIGEVQKKFPHFNSIGITTFKIPQIKP